MWSTRFNPITGIIPACQDHFDSDNFSKVKAPIDHYARLKKGSPTTGRHYPTRGPAIPKVGSLIGEPKPSVPSYTGIQNENTIHHPDDYEVLITAEIREDLNVYLNGVLIAESPKLKRNARGKDIQTTQAEKARFCRGVIWWLMNDEICLKDKLSEIGYCAPAPVVIPAVPAMVPADISIESITGSVYPGYGLIDGEIKYSAEYAYELIQKETRDTIKNELIDEGSDDPGYDILDDAFNPEPAAEIIRAFDQGPGIKQFPAGWINHLKITITEESCTA